MQITTIGLDIAKHVFQVHGTDAKEKVVLREQLRRGQVIAFFKALPPIMYDTWDQSNRGARVALAHKALATSPLCASYAEPPAGGHSMSNRENRRTRCTA